MSDATTTDLYDVTRAMSCPREGRAGPATFSLFVRDLPAEQGFLVAAGLESALEHLSGLRFTGSARAVPEGRIALAGEPRHSGPYRAEEEAMPHTLDWKVRLYLFEEKETTKARAVLDTGTTVLTGHGTARRNPADPEVPEIGDELAAGRALQDLGRQLVDIAEHDVQDTGAAGPNSPPPVGWPT